MLIGEQPAAPSVMAKERQGAKGAWGSLLLAGRDPVPPGSREPVFQAVPRARECAPEMIGGHARAMAAVGVSLRIIEPGMSCNRPPWRAAERERLSLWFVRRARAAADVSLAGGEAS